MAEKEILDLTLQQGWTLDLLEERNRSKLALKILPHLKIIEDKSLFRLEELSYPESRLMTVVLLVQKENRKDKELVMGMCESDEINDVIVVTRTFNRYNQTIKHTNTHTHTLPPSHTHTHTHIHIHTLPQTHTLTYLVQGLLR